MTTFTILGYEPAQVRKAIAGGIAASVAAVVPLFAVAIADLHIERVEAGGMVGALATGALAGFLAVFRTRNAPVTSPAKRRRSTTSKES